MAIISDINGILKVGSDGTINIIGGTIQIDGTTVIDNSGIFSGDGSGLTNVDATTLDSVDSSSFLRSDVADTKTSGDLSFSDNVKAIFGAGSDLQIYHDGSNSYITEGGVGNLYFSAGNLYLRKTTGENLIYTTNAGAVIIHYNSAQKLATTSTGIDVTGNATFADNGKAIFGAGSDLQIYHDGSNSYIDDAGEGSLFLRSGTTYIQNAAGTKTSIVTNAGAGQTLYHNNTPVFETTATGIDVTGNITVSGTVDGRDIATDGTKLDGIESGATADQVITAGSGITVTGTGDVTIAHSDTSSVANVTSTAGTFISGLTFDTFGHVTAVATASESASANDATITLSAGTYISGGGDFTTDQSLNETITFNHDTTTRTDTTSASSASFGGTFTAVDSVTTNTTGHVTAINLKTVTLPTEADTLATVTGRGATTATAIAITNTTASTTNDTGALTVDGGVGINGNINIGGNSDIDGNLVIGGNLTVSGTTTTVNTETINLADNIIVVNSNYTGSTPTEDAGIEVERGTLTNAQLVWDESVDRWVVAGAATGTLAYTSEIGTGTLTVSAGSGISLSADPTFNANASANKTITVTHSDTSTQASVNNSGGTVIQDVTLDTYGHVTGLVSYDLDGRYYTESEADSRFFNVAGDTVTGDAYFNATTFWQVSAADTAAQRVDARDDATNLSRLHWYGVSDTSGTSNFRHAWYDGNNYISVTANASGRIDFAGSAATMYIGADRVFDDGYHPNADAWTTARTITLGGDLSGSVSIDGSANVTLTATVANDSHTHSIYLPKAGGTVTGSVVLDQASSSGQIVHDVGGVGGGVYITKPLGGSYKTTYSAITGALAIKLPTQALGDNDMISFWVDIYDYAGDTQGESLSVFVYGYTGYNNWGNTGGTILSDRADRDYTIRFGNDGTRQIVYIGEVGSQWEYPQVSVRDFQSGYTTPHTLQFDGAWEVTFVTAFGTIQKTSSTNYPVSNQWKTSRTATVTLTGDVTGTVGVSVDGTANWTNSVATQIAANVVNANELNVTGNGTTAQYLRSDGDGTFTWATPTGTMYTLPLATDTVRGGIELFSTTDQTVAPNTLTATEGRTYGLQLNAADQAMVNVPWTDTVYTHPTTAGNKHIPTGGTVGQILKNTASGTATWQADNNTTYSVGDGGLSEINFTSADNTKLDGIEAGATADQTAAQILTAIKTVDGSGSGLDADLLDGKDHTNFGATLATYGTTAGASGRIRCTAPFATNSAHMFQVTVSLYSNYVIHNYVVGGYMYPTTNQWYASTCIYSGGGSPDIVVGRDTNGKAYISIANSDYTGVRVHNMTLGYQTSVADTYDPWTITVNAATENSVTPTISKTWHSTNDGTGSGLDADLLDGQEGSYYTGYADTAVANLVAAAPATLDTLNELAAALGDDPNFATTVAASIALKAPIANPSFTGNIAVTGTVDGRDIAADGTKLDGIEALADVTDATNVTAAGALMDSELAGIAAVKALNQGVATTDSPTFAGLTTTGDVSFSDNNKAIFGTGSDLEIYHDGSNSYISDTSGTGDLYIRGANLRLTDPDGTLFLYGANNSNTRLYFAGVQKLTTTSTGTTINGTLNILPSNGIGSYTLPASDGTSGQVLTTNGSGAITFAATAADSTKLPLAGGALTGAVTTNSTFDGRNVSVDGAKLDGIAASANNYTHPTGAGNNHIPTGGTVGQILKNTASGTATWQADNNTTYSVGDGGLTEKNFTSADNTKLDSIEAGATADQTAAEILTAIKTVDGAGSGLDADLLDGQQGSSYLRSNVSATNTVDLRAPIFIDNSNSAYFVDPAATGDSIRVAGDVVAYYSDERLKNIESNIPNALDKVSKLNGFYYTPNKTAQDFGYKEKREVGVSAQEVESVLPEIVKDAPIGHGYKTVQYEKLVALLIEAVKELKESHDKEINALKNEIAKLKSQ